MKKRKNKEKRPSLSQTFKVWADGSFDPRNNYMGIGFLVLNEQNILHARGDFSLKRNKRTTSTVAEVLACSHALATLPQNSRIVLHNDCDFVVTNVQNERFEHRKRHLHKTLGHLFEQICRHNTVTAVLTKDKDSFYLKQAHNLSVAGRTKPLKFV